MNRLEYRPLTAADFEPMARLWADPEVIRYTAVERPCTPEQTGLRLRALLDGQKGLPVPTLYLVLCEAEPCGVIGCPPFGRERRRFGLFYQFLPAFWGRGIGEQAVRWMVERMRESYPGADLAADVVERNTASLRILRGLDFVEKGVKRDGFRRGGETLAVCSFVLPARGGEPADPAPG